MRIGLALVLLLVAAPAASGAVGGPTCSNVATASGDVGSFVRVETCSAFFPRADRYRPARYRVASGSLPPGLSLWGDGGPAAQIDGVPRRVGVYRFTVAATDAGGRRARGAYTVRINPRLRLPEELIPSRVTLGSAYTARVTARGGQPPYTYELSFPGLSIGRTNGVISGIPTVNGIACGLPVSVTDATGATVETSFGMDTYDHDGRPFDVAGCMARLGPFVALAGSRAFAGAGSVASRGVVTIHPLTLNGRGLANVVGVRFAGVRAVFAVDSDERLTAVPPVGARSGALELLIRDGRWQNAGTYTVRR